MRAMPVPAKILIVDDDQDLSEWSSPKKVDTDRIDLFVSLGVFSEFGNVD